MPRVLVCPPTHFGVEYVINPWMAGQVGAASRAKAAKQWDALVAILEKVADVRAIEPGPGLPDMCFAANGGFVLGDTFVATRFAVSQRQPEEALYHEWAASAGFDILEGAADLPFEGEGDALWWPRPGSARGYRSQEKSPQPGSARGYPSQEKSPQPGSARGYPSQAKSARGYPSQVKTPPVLWAGYGVRTALGAHKLLAERLRVRVESLHLVDPRFYHLDTCFVPLPGGRIVYYPPAFDARSLRRIKALAPPAARFAVGEEDARHFACNAVRIGDTWIANHASPALRERLESWGYQVVTTQLTEFMKAGGAAKCLALVLDQALPEAFDERPAVASPLRSAEVELEGHLLSEGSLDRAFEIASQAGGSLRLSRFHGGERSDQPSIARLEATGPDDEALAEIVRRLGHGNAKLVHADSDGDAVLAPAPKAGVAPEDFCCSTIYPTDVHVGGRWLRVRDQRMDAAIAVDAADAGNANAEPIARCVLPRNLRRGQQVVVGEGGVRVQMPPRRSASDGFAFMSASVSSERRVEAQIAELALEMRRIRARGGRIVVVAGPVVIHTGGGEHLAALIRAGFVQALLTGNALPVHDLEANLFGTSLGVDLVRGAGVRGGHRHHLRTINRIRAAGSIAAAVEDGLVDGGVMYECVRAKVPYVLAGSIRDDGPLPDTEMDLLKAQAAYQIHIAGTAGKEPSAGEREGAPLAGKEPSAGEREGAPLASKEPGAELILMLATMLHAIGVGNMTPAGVRLVCVDINPAVVTKLADRGSVASTGIVTDVGLFLKLLAERVLAEPASVSEPRPAPADP